MPRQKKCKFGGVRSEALFTVACAHAQKGSKDDAFANLRLAIEAGFKKKWQIEGSPHLAALRGDARYGEILKSL